MCLWQTGSTIGRRSEDYLQINEWSILHLLSLSSRSPLAFDSGHRTRIRGERGRDAQPLGTSYDFGGRWAAICLRSASDEHCLSFRGSVVAPLQPNRLRLALSLSSLFAPNSCSHRNSAPGAASGEEWVRG